MNVSEAIFARRAVRDFTSDPVSEEAIRELIEAAVQAPSAKNVQPWAFVVIQDTELLCKISKRAGDLVRRVGIPEKLKKALEDPAWNIFYNASTLVVICARNEPGNPEWDCCLAAENLMLAALEKGLGACPIGFSLGALAESDIKDLVGIPQEYRAVMPIILGHPRVFPDSPGRKDAEILSWKIAAKV